MWFLIIEKKEEAAPGFVDKLVTQIIKNVQVRRAGCVAPSQTRHHDHRGSYKNISFSTALFVTAIQWLLFVISTLYWSIFVIYEQSINHISLSEIRQP